MYSQLNMMNALYHKMMTLRVSISLDCSFHSDKYVINYPFYVVLSVSYHSIKADYLMCILFIAVDQHPQFPLIIAANRDEFHARPTASSHFWEHHPDLLAGTDLQAGGTWLGVTRNGNIAGLTNIRAPGTDRSDATTRGDLVINALLNQHSWTSHTQQLHASADQYNGFNLLYGDWRNLQVFNSHTLSHHALGKGVYGLSNAQLNTPWPKIQHGMAALNALCQTSDQLDVDAVFKLLNNPQQANDDRLPNTGITAPLEKLLSAIFIISPEYGTRCSTVITVDQQGKLAWQERSFAPSGLETNRSQYDISLTNQ